MSRWTPCKRRELIRRLRALGFEGPFSRTRHRFMVFQQFRLAIPGDQEYSVARLRMMITEVEGILSRELTLKEWNQL